MLLIIGALIIINRHVMSKVATKAIKSTWGVDGYFTAGVHPVLLAVSMVFLVIWGVVNILLAFT